MSNHFSTKKLNITRKVRESDSESREVSIDKMNKTRHKYDIRIFNDNHASNDSFDNSVSFGKNTDIIENDFVYTNRQK
jgi:hypothetical protein